MIFALQRHETKQYFFQAIGTKQIWLMEKNEKTVHNWYCRIPVYGLHSMYDLDEATEFLARVKLLVSDGALRFDPRNRRKTWEFLHNESLLVGDVFEIINGLVPSECEWGPRSDDNGSRGEVWLFSTMFTSQQPPYNRIRLYIKLKIWTDISGDVGIVMSFHEWGRYE